ncbi:MAG: hypothetical protein J6C27_05175 [Clostridia bacterium]|nr:hypothetical protein [Clostridia bacterium]
MRKLHKALLWSVLTLMVLSISVGYANLTDILDIQGITEVKPQNGVFITTINASSGVTVNNYIGTVINSKADISGGEVTINVTVYNNADVVYGYNVMKYVVGENTYDNENIEIVTEMKQKHTDWMVQPKGYMTFPVTFKFKSGAATTNAILNSIVEFEFLPFHEIPDNVEESTVSNAMDRFEEVLNTPEEYNALIEYMNNPPGWDRNSSYISNVRDANDTDKASIEELFSGNLHININGEQHDVKIMIKRENVTSAYSGDEMTIYMTTDPLTSRGKAVVYRCVYVNDNGVWKRDGVMTEGTATVCDYTFGSSWGTGSFNTNTWAAS